jgi:hypothetical protein
VDELHPAEARNAMTYMHDEVACIQVKETVDRTRFQPAPWRRGRVEPRLAMKQLLTADDDHPPIAAGGLGGCPPKFLTRG